MDKGSSIYWVILQDWTYLRVKSTIPHN